MDKNKPLYMIGVAAELVGIHPQTLRIYEKIGLVKPNRSSGKTRLYSQEDIEKLKKIHYLTQDLGVNLAGVEVILDMLEKMDLMKKQIEEEMEKMKKEMEDEIKIMEKHFEEEI